MELCPSSSSPKADSRFHSFCGEVLASPFPIIRLLHGNPLYGTPDLVEEMVQNEGDGRSSGSFGDGCYIGQFEVADLVNRTISQPPMRLLYTQNPRQLSIFSARNMDSGVTATSNTGLTVNQASGRKQMSNADYILRASLEIPDAIISLADEVPFSASRKKVAKSSERSLQWFRELRASSLFDWSKTFLFGVAVPGGDLDRIAAMAKILKDEGANGIVVGGCGMGETSEERINAIRRVREVVGDETPILVQGMDSAEEILSSLQGGADFVGTNYPSITSNIGCALRWSVLPSLPSPGRESDCESDFTPEEYTMSLLNARYRSDPDPMVQGCSCHACRNHSRAYIHHLLRVHELLAEVLLYVHNQYQVMWLFKAARRYRMEKRLDDWLAMLSDLL